MILYHIMADTGCLPDDEIAEYVHTKYKPGLLNPFKGTSLYIKS